MDNKKNYTYYTSNENQSSHSFHQDTSMDSNLNDPVSEVIHYLFDKVTNTMASAILPNSHPYQQQINHSLNRQCSPPQGYQQYQPKITCQSCPANQPQFQQTHGYPHNQHNPDPYFCENPPAYSNPQNTYCNYPMQEGQSYGPQNTPASFNSGPQSFNYQPGYQNDFQFGPQGAYPHVIGQGMPATHGNLGFKNFHAHQNIFSLKARLDSNPINDANTIYTAFKGFNADWKGAMNVLTHRTTFQRQKIKEEFVKLYQKSLTDRMESQLKYPLVHIAVALGHAGLDMDAYFLHIAIKRRGIDESAYINLLCTRFGGEIKEISRCYQNMFKRSLLDDIRFDTIGKFKDFLSHLLTTPREDSNPASTTLADMHVRELETRNIIKMSPPDCLIKILCTSSFAQIKLTMQHFYIANGKTLYDWIKEHTDNNYTRALISICLFAENPIRFFSTQLKNSIEKNDINIVILIVCTRCEIDLGVILQDYQMLNKSSAEADIQRVFGGDHQSSVDSLYMLMGLA